MYLSAIVARDTTNVIGVGNKLPWHCPEDLNRFKHLTVGKLCVFGRKTFESFNKPEGLPNRVNLVLTKDPVLIRQKNTESIEWSRTNVLWLNLKDFWTENWNKYHPEIMICGGTEIYDLFSGSIKRIYSTDFDIETEKQQQDTIKLFPIETGSNWNMILAEKKQLETKCQTCKGKTMVDTWFRIYDRKGI
jgi:dihydrofolate reductase